MPPTKKNAVAKTANRPYKDIALPDATMIAPITSSRSIKSGSKDRVTKTRSNKGNMASRYLKEDDDGDDEDYHPSGGHYKSVSSNAFEFDHSMAEDSDDEFVIGKKTRSKAAGKSKQKIKAETKIHTNTKVETEAQIKSKKKKDGTAPDPHGRVKGRDLIPWTRPRMFEKLLLHLQYEAELAGIELPWDAAVHRLHIGSNKGAATQQLAKLREILLTEGHMVPPRAKVKNKRGVEFNPKMRGYIRPDGSTDPYEMRVVGWYEKVVDRSKNIDNPDIHRGSGRYPRIGRTGPVAAATRGGNAPKPARGARSAASKPKLMITLKLDPKHLSKFPPGPGDVPLASNPHCNHHQDAHNETTLRYEVESDGEREDEIDDVCDDESSEEEFGNEIDSGSEVDDDFRAHAIKQEDVDHDELSTGEMQGVADEVNGYMPGQTENSLNSGGVGGTIHATARSNDTHGGLVLGNFDSNMDGCVANRFGRVAGFNSSAGGFGGHHMMYSSGTLDQRNMYGGPSMVGSNSYVSPASSMGRTAGMRNGYGMNYGMSMGMDTHPSLSGSYYQRPTMGHVPAVGAFQSSARANMMTGYEQNGASGSSTYVKVSGSPTYKYEAVSEGHGMEEELFESTLSQVHSSDIFGSGSAKDENEDEDSGFFDSFLQHDTFEISD